MESGRCFGQRPDCLTDSITDLAWLWQYHAQKDSSAFSIHAPQVGSRIDPLLLLYTPANYIFRSLGKSATEHILTLGL